MLRFFFDKMQLDDVRVNFVRPEGYAEGSKDLTPHYTEVVPVLMKSILLNEFHFRKNFTFGGFPMCVLPKKLLQSKKLLRANFQLKLRSYLFEHSLKNRGNCLIGQSPLLRAIYNAKSQASFTFRNRLSLINIK